MSTNSRRNRWAVLFVVRGCFRFDSGWMTAVGPSPSNAFGSPCRPAVLQRNCCQSKGQHLSCRVMSRACPGKSDPGRIAKGVDLGCQSSLSVRSESSRRSDFEPPLRRMPIGKPEQLFHQQQRMPGASSGSGSPLAALKRLSNPKPSLFTRRRDRLKTVLHFPNFREMAPPWWADPYGAGKRPQGMCGEHADVAIPSYPVHHPCRVTETQSFPKAHLKSPADLRSFKRHCGSVNHGFGKIGTGECQQTLG